MQKHIVAGIDIGTHEVKVVVTESAPENERALPKIIGVGTAESKGLRRGYIVNEQEATESILEAVGRAEKNSGTRIRKAVISIGGVSLQSFTGTGSTLISRGDSEVTTIDIDKATAAAERTIPANHMTNRRVIHTVPLSYKIDGKAVFGRPQGMKGAKLEAKVIFITCLSQHLDDLIEAVSDAGIEVLDIVATPIAASIVTLSKNQKVAGCVLVDIGAETLSLVVFENNLPVSLEVFPIGATDITNDIALGLKISIEDAELLKRGSSPAHIQFSKKKLDEIISARLSDVFELIEGHLKKIDKNGLLPAGIIITGGTAHIANITDLAKDILHLPSKTAPAKEAIISVAYGLSMIGLNGNDTPPGGFSKTGATVIIKTLNWFKQFLP